MKKERDRVREWESEGERGIGRQRRGRQRVSEFLSE